MKSFTEIVQSLPTVRAELAAQKQRAAAEKVRPAKAARYADICDGDAAKEEGRLRDQCVRDRDAETRRRSRLELALHDQESRYLDLKNRHHKEKADLEAWFAANPTDELRPLREAVLRVRDHAVHEHFREPVVTFAVRSLDDDLAILLRQPSVSAQDVAAVRDRALRELPGCCCALLAVPVEEVA